MTLSVSTRLRIWIPMMIIFDVSVQIDNFRIKLVTFDNCCVQTVYLSYILIVIPYWNCFDTDFQCVMSFFYSAVFWEISVSSHLVRCLNCFLHFQGITYVLEHFFYVDCLCLHLSVARVMSTVSGLHNLSCDCGLTVALTCLDLVPVDLKFQYFWSCLTRDCS
jgi:hypothetical protein